MTRHRLPLAVVFAAAALLLHVPGAVASAQEMPPRAALPIAQAPQAFRLPNAAPAEAITLGRNLHKATGAAMYPGGPQWVATVRAAPVPFKLASWRAVDGGYVTRFRLSAEGAEGLRARFDLGTVPGAMEVRAAGDDGRVFTMTLDPMLGNEAWGPWTDGATQVVEVFSTVRPSAEALTVGALLNFDVGPTTKAAASCTVSTLCSTGNTGTDAAIAEAKKSIMRINGVVDGRGFNCSATLINTAKFPAAYVLTANHCVSTTATAASLTTRWFWETTACDVADASTSFQQVAGGMQLIFTNFNVDSTLMLMNSPPPTGAVYSGFSTGRLNDGTAVVSLSHPAADAARQARGSMTGLIRPSTETVSYPQDMYEVIFTVGATEGGSSGSGLFVQLGGSLRLTGILFGGTIGDSCTNPRDGIYSRFEIFHPQIDPYISLASVPVDDAPNRALDIIGTPLDPVADLPLNQRSGPLVIAGKQIGAAGDIDVYRFTLSQERAVALWSESSIDTIGTLLNQFGTGLESNDDGQTSSLDFGITRLLQAGTYFVQVAHFDGDGTGGYTVKAQAYDVGSNNYSDLWWNANESGWGINLSHQGTVIFATLYTYDTDGTPMWLVMSNGDRQADGSFTGILYRVTGPAFNASPWGPINAVQVGTMRLRFDNADLGTLTYTVNGASVSKQINRYSFGTAPTCKWSVFDRSFANNVQDLWWNPAENGWGINLVHQGNTIFATLYTYGPDGKAMWYVMSAGARQADGTFRGALYRTTGPAFNANPWTAISNFEVGTMTLKFYYRDDTTIYPGGGGNRATLTYTVNGVSVTKQIQRFDFANPKTECER
ncbi:trypsin-like serine peptidase [Usitatibacter palustris]|uniref:Peptidase S1 domain-containing protein n=1 Tax=Usitatibacter palustris TaxID=2732487 RepID=A0A6M4H7E0_9PROT|nr:trypsin-like serine protease [Usitatibacter palustris]QJR14294.1 hypothetical protein DSM104440_01087 [Usitatibacter palustris]